jgi:hypothetical protein
VVDPPARSEAIRLLPPTTHHCIPWVTGCRPSDEHPHGVSHSICSLFTRGGRSYARRVRAARLAARPTRTRWEVRGCDGSQRQSLCWRRWWR